MNGDCAIEVQDTLVERLAEKVHESWMTRRLSEGWIYGVKWDDALKTQPCLVPYDRLPESEKEYDRATVAATLRGLQEMGYEIVQKGKEKMK